MHAAPALRALARAAPATVERAATAEAVEAGTLLEKRRLLVLLRTGLTLAISYLLIFSAASPVPPPLLLIFVVGYLASNIIIAVMPTRILAKAGFDVGLILTDTAAISFALLLIPDANTDVFIFYFTIILLASISDRLMLSLLAPIVTSGAYLAFLLARHDIHDVLQPAILLRLPFFLLTGTFYGFFVDRVRRGQAAVDRGQAARPGAHRAAVDDHARPQAAALGRQPVGGAALRAARPDERLDARARRPGDGQPQADGVAHPQLPRSEQDGDACSDRVAAPHLAEPDRRRTSSMPTARPWTSRACARHSSSQRSCRPRGSTRCRQSAASPTCSTTRSSIRRRAAP